MENPLTIDIDLFEIEAWRAKYLVMKHLGCNVEFHLTKHGIHIINHDLPDDFNLRLLYGDDIKRVWMDMQRAKHNLPTGVLFDYKNGYKVTVTKDIMEVFDWIVKVRKNLHKHHGLKKK